MTPGEFEERVIAESLDAPVDAKLDRLIAVCSRGLLYVAQALGADLEIGDIDPWHTEEAVETDPSPNQQAAMFRMAWR